MPTGKDDVVRVTDLVEKPPAGEAPSNWVVIGRYVFDPAIFEVLGDPPGTRQRDPAHRRPAYPRRRRGGDEGGVHGVLFSGRRYDTGNKLDYLRTVMQFAATAPTWRRTSCPGSSSSWRLPCDRERTGSPMQSSTTTFPTPAAVRPLPRGRWGWTRRWAPRSPRTSPPRSPAALRQLGDGRLRRRADDVASRRPPVTLPVIDDIAAGDGRCRPSAPAWSWDHDGRADARRGRRGDPGRVDRRRHRAGGDQPPRAAGQRHPQAGDDARAGDVVLPVGTRLGPGSSGCWRGRAAAWSSCGPGRGSW